METQRFRRPVGLLGFQPNLTVVSLFYAFHYILDIRRHLAHSGSRFSLLQKMAANREPVCRHPEMLDISSVQQ